MGRSSPGLSIGCDGQLFDWKEFEPDLIGLAPHYNGRFSVVLDHEINDFWQFRFNEQFQARTLIRDVPNETSDWLMTMARVKSKHCLARLLTRLATPLHGL